MIGRSRKGTRKFRMEDLIYIFTRRYNSECRVYIFGMEQAKQWLKKGREHRNREELIDSLRCFATAATFVPCWSPPYIFCGMIYLQLNRIHCAENMLAIARVLSSLKSHPPLKAQLVDNLRRCELTCLGKATHIKLPPPRDDNYPSTCHLTISPEVFSDDIVQPDDFIYLNEECIITEKLDGGNCCLDFVSGLVYARTHGHEATHDSFGPIKTLFRAMQRDNADLYKLLQSRGIRLFGENMFGLHSISYTHIGSVFYIFAAYGVPMTTDPLCMASSISTARTVGIDVPAETMRWYSWQEIEAIAGLIGFPTVPVVRRGPFASITALKTFLDAQAEKPSALSQCCPAVSSSAEACGSSGSCCWTDHPQIPAAEKAGNRRVVRGEVVLPEGFVIRTARGFSDADFEFCIGKYVRKHHVQTDSTWRRTWKKVALCSTCADSAPYLSETDHSQRVWLEELDSMLDKCELHGDGGISRQIEFVSTTLFLKTVMITILDSRRNNTRAGAVNSALGTGIDNNTSEPSASCDRDVSLIKFPRTPHLLVAGEGMGVTRDDLMIEASDRRAYFQGHVIVQEKVDGANIGISITPNYEIRIQNRSHFVCGETSSQFKTLDNWIEKHRLELLEILRPGRDILYGEWLYARHSVPYDSLLDYFLAFDMFDRRTGSFFTVSRLTSLLAATTIRMVPLIGVFDFCSDADILSLLSMPSRCCKQNAAVGDEPGDGQLVEGLYLRLETSDHLLHRSKVVREDFIQTINDGKHWSKRNMEKNLISVDAEYKF